MNERFADESGDLAGDAGLGRVSTPDLLRLRKALATGRLRAPISRSDLVALGIRHQVAAIAAVLEGHMRPACEAILDMVLAERAKAKRPAPELVWTGPEGTAAGARDTAVVLRELFEGARHRVVLAGYSFDHARDVLAPLHRAMVEHGVAALFIVAIPQAQGYQADPKAYADRRLADFARSNWPFGSPFPRLFYDKRALRPGPPWHSMHAKCVVIDETNAFVSSANFTQRGQERNIEAGVLLRDPLFAANLAQQWYGLIDSDLVGEWVVSKEATG